MCVCVCVCDVGAGEIVQGRNPSRLAQIQQDFDGVQKQFPEFGVFISGHSLGGNLADGTSLRIPRPCILLIYSHPLLLSRRDRHENAPVSVLLVTRPRFPHLPFRFASALGLHALKVVTNVCVHSFNPGGWGKHGASGASDTSMFHTHKFGGDPISVAYAALGYEHRYPNPECNGLDLSLKAHGMDSFGPYFEYLYYFDLPFLPSLVFFFVFVFPARYNNPLRV